MFCRLLWTLVYAAFVYFTPYLLKNNGALGVNYYVLLGLVSAINEVRGSWYNVWNMIKSQFEYFRSKPFPIRSITSLFKNGYTHRTLICLQTTRVYRRLWIVSTGGQVYTFFIKLFSFQSDHKTIFENSDIRLQLVFYRITLNGCHRNNINLKTASAGRDVPSWY